MLREELLQKTLTVLEEAGFSMARQFSPSCFDILARRSDIILLIKVLTNVDSLYEEQASDLKRVAKVLSASPLVVGIISKTEYMKEKTIYERYGIPAINFETFEEAIEDSKMPVVYAKKGGFYAHINPDYLRQIREKHKLSIGQLAREAGISKKSLVNYEQGKGAEIENILRLQKALGDLLLDTINFFDYRFEASILQPPSSSKKFETDVSKRLGKIGFQTTAVQRAPFKLIGKHEDDILLTGFKKQSLEKKARDIHSSAETLGQHGMFVLEREKRKAVSGVPIIKKYELEEVVSSKELLKLLRELSGED